MLCKFKKIVNRNVETGKRRRNDKGRIASGRGSGNVVPCRKIHEMADDEPRETAAHFLVAQDRQA